MVRQVIVLSQEEAKRLEQGEVLTNKDVVVVCAKDNFDALRKLVESEGKE